MVSHVVMFKIADPEARAEVKRRLDALVGEIPGLKAVETGINAGGDARAYDLCLISRLESWETLAEYAVHPKHAEVVEYIKSVASHAVVVDWADAG